MVSTVLGMMVMMPVVFGVVGTSLVVRRRAGRCSRGDVRSHHVATHIIRA